MQNVDMNNNIITLGTGALQFNAADEAISIQSGSMFFDVPTTDSFSFDVAGTPELVIDGTVINAATNTFQEAGVDISPIGVHDIWISATGMWESTTGGCAALAKTELATDQDIQTLDFDGAAVEAAQFSITFPDNWNAGTITATFYWSANAAVTTDVDWRISGVSIADNQLLTTAYGTAITVTDAHNGAINELDISADTAAITVAGAGKSEFLRFLVERDGVSDTMTQDARLHGIMLHITTDAATA